MRRRPPRSTLFPYTTLFPISPQKFTEDAHYGMAHSVHDIVADTVSGFIYLTGSNADRKSTRLNSSHRCISYAVFCLKKKKNIQYNIVPLNKMNITISQLSDLP